MTLKDVVMSNFLPLSVREAALNELIVEAIWEWDKVLKQRGKTLNCSFQKLGQYEVPAFISDAVEAFMPEQKPQAIKLLRAFAMTTGQEPSLRVAKETVENFFITKPH